MLSFQIEIFERKNEEKIVRYLGRRTKTVKRCWWLSVYVAHTVFNDTKKIILNVPLPTFRLYAENKQIPSIRFKTFASYGVCTIIKGENTTIGFKSGTNRRCFFSSLGTEFSFKVHFRLSNLCPVRLFCFLSRDTVILNAISQHVGVNFVCVDEFARAVHHANKSVGRCTHESSKCKRSVCRCRADRQIARKIDTSNRLIVPLSFRTNTWLSSLLKFSAVLLFSYLGRVRVDS